MHLCCGGFVQPCSTLDCVRYKYSCLKKDENIVQDTGYGIRDMGYGIRDMEYGITEYGIRDSGYGIQVVVIFLTLYLDSPVYGVTDLLKERLCFYLPTKFPHPTCYKHNHKNTNILRLFLQSLAKSVTSGLPASNINRSIMNTEQTSGTVLQ